MTLIGEIVRDDLGVFDIAIQMRIDELMARGLTLDQAIDELRWVSM